MKVGNAITMTRQTFEKSTNHGKIMKIAYLAFVQCKIIYVTPIVGHWPNTSVVHWTVIRGPGPDDDLLHCACHQGETVSVQSDVLPLLGSCGGRRLGQWIFSPWGISYNCKGLPCTLEPGVFSWPTTLRTGSRLSRELGLSTPLCLHCVRTWSNAKCRA